MINLLPPDHAAAIRYGRQNTALRKWLLGMAAAIAGLILIMISGWFYIHRQAGTLQNNITTTNQQLKAQNLAQVQADAKTITGDITEINQVLRSEVRFSDLIQTIGTYMPPGTVLDGISIGNVSGGLDLTLSGTSQTTLAQAAVNLSDPKNQLFSSVDIENISCNSRQAETTKTPYLCSSQLRVLFSNDAKLKFLNVPKAGGS